MRGAASRRIAAQTKEKITSATLKTIYASLRALVLLGGFRSATKVQEEGVIAFTTNIHELFGASLWDKKQLLFMLLFILYLLQHTSQTGFSRSLAIDDYAHSN